MRPGLYVFDLSTELFEYVPISTMNMYNATPLAIYAAKNVSQEILVGYQDPVISKNYIGVLSATAGTTGVYIPEVLADSPDEKAAEALVANLGLSPNVATPQTLTFTLALKLYNFKRPLWGTSVTNALASTTSTIRVDGTSTTNTPALAGDEVTILDGTNAGNVRHIATIANQGASNETWTLDSALPNATGNAVHLTLQPFALVEKKTVTAAAQLGEFHFNVKNKTRGKKFLAKLLFEGMTNVQLELHRSEFVFDDLGHTT
jgi:hypothetical protein